MHCASVRYEMNVSLMVCAAFARHARHAPPCATRPSNGAITVRYTTHFLSHRSPPLPDLLAPASPLDQRITDAPGKLIPALFWTNW